MSLIIKNDESNDIEMSESTNDFPIFIFHNKNKKYFNKRTYYEMINNAKESELDKRRENFLLSSIYKQKMDENYQNSNYYPFSYSNSTNDNGLVMVKRKYDEEKEKKFVENYYKVKNEELMKLRENFVTY